MLSRGIDYTNRLPSHVPTHSSGWILECRRKLDTLVRRPLHLACNATLTEVETVVFFCRAHARNTHVLYVPTERLQFGAFGSQQRKKTPKGRRASERFSHPASTVVARSSFDFPCQRCTSAHTDLQRNTVMVSHISLTLVSQGAM